MGDGLVNRFTPFFIFRANKHLTRRGLWSIIDIMKPTKVLIFDKWSKAEMFKKWMKSTRTVRCLYCFDPSEAIKMVREERPEIILLGGDPINEDLNAPKFWNMMIETKMHKRVHVIISTWNTDEAQILRNMIPKAFYLPFSEPLANMVKAKARNIRLHKQRKENERRRMLRKFSQKETIT